MTVIYQLKIGIKGSQPPIWRRIQVANNTTFSELHDMIQIAFGREGEHEYEFTINKTRVYDFGAEFGMGDDPGERDSTDTMLDDYVSLVNKRFTYLYDFEDRWEHAILLEKIISDEENIKHPVCIGGERACPPEDCGGILAYQSMLGALSDKNHPQHKSIKKQLGKNWDAGFFNSKHVNDSLQQYAREWEKIYDETGEIIDRLERRERAEDHEEYDYDDDPEEEDPEDFEDRFNEYESLRHLTCPRDLLGDEQEKSEMEGWIEEGLKDDGSMEQRTFTRLLSLGHDEGEAKSLIIDCLAIEWFYELKYGTDYIDERFDHNLDRLPEKPLEIPSLDHAILVLDRTEKGIPFHAIEYLYNDPSPASASAIIKALKNVPDHQYCWGDCTTAPFWYTLAAEGHLSEDLIDPVIGLCERNENESDWLLEQAEYLIGKLAQKYSDLTAAKVLDAMEKDAKKGTGDWVFYLFDVFYFCDISKYKQRLLALLERDDLSWHDCLASTLAFLQVKEALPVLKRQLNELESEEDHDSYDTIELKEAIQQLETGENLYTDVDTPICLRRTTTWREEMEGKEELFYDDYDDPFDESDFSDDFSLPQQQFGFPGPGAWGQPVIKGKKPGRNAPCPCGSGRKYKKCCMDKE